MGMMSFQLPGGLDVAALHELEKACIVGGPDELPAPALVRPEANSLAINRPTEESGCLLVPWEVDGIGRVMGASATLIERPGPYHFQVELARGKINQVRCQAADWQAGGLQIPPTLAGQIRSASLGFGLAVTHVPSAEAAPLAQTALALGYQTAEQLVQLYTAQMFQARQQRNPRLETALGCSLGPAAPAPGPADAVLQACNSVCLPLVWKDIESTKNNYCWDTFDGLLAWAHAQGLAITAGPLFDFSPHLLPNWLFAREQDLSTLSSVLCGYVDRVVRRYRGRISTWQLTAASNLCGIPGLGEDECLWLTVRLAEAVRQVDPRLEIVISLAQPWGEQRTTENGKHSPFIFADTLIRSGLNVAALDLELIMGITPRGSYCRDLLETSRLLDLYSLLGVPIRVTLGYPSTADHDPKAVANFRVGAGHWHGGYSPEVQADWAAAFVALALCKPSVRGVNWVHLSDADPHQFPHCGLLDQGNQPKPALEQLRQLRDQYLR